MNLKFLLNVTVSCIALIGFAFWLSKGAREHRVKQAERQEIYQLNRELEKCREENQNNAMLADPRGTSEQIASRVAAACQPQVQALAQREGTIDELRENLTKRAKADVDRARRLLEAKARAEFVEGHIKKMLAELEKAGVTEDEVSAYFLEEAGAKECE